MAEDPQVAAFCDVGYTWVTKQERDGDGVWGCARLVAERIDGEE